MVTRNEENCVEGAIQSALPYVDDFRWFDTGSDDGTVDILKQYGVGVSIKCDLMQFDFGAAKTLVSRMAQTPWIMLLDADERLVNGGRLRDLINNDADCWAFPRERWADLEKTQQVEPEAFPDWQYRLYQNTPYIYWNGILHESLVGPTKKVAQIIARLDHFVDPFHLTDPARRGERTVQRLALAKRAGVTVEGSPTATRLAGIPQ